MESPGESNSIISDRTKDKVSSVLWLDYLKAEDAKLQQRVRDRNPTDDRCMVCTLPFGTCEHTQQWLETTRKNLELDSFKSVLEKEIDDMLNVFDDGFEVDTTPVAEDVDINGMQWSRLEQRLTDKIGATGVSLFAPDERGWHSCVKLNDKLVAVFGGFRYKNKVVPQPFRTVPNPQDIEFLNDIRIYDVDNLCWFGVRARGGVDGEGETTYEEPEGRYGHVASALPGNRMLVYGGRGANGKIFSDTWIYHYDNDRWEWAHYNEAIGLSVPSPRYFTSAVTAPGTHSVYLFGGTNGVENYGDLWVFSATLGDKIQSWERLVAVGLPPCPRYGHSCVAIDEDQIAIVGGCHVSPSGEMVGSNLSTTETKTLLEMSNNLQKRYRAENSMAKRGGQALESQIEYFGPNFSASAEHNNSTVGSTHLTDVYHQASKLSGSLHILEQDTRHAEMQMMNSYKLSQASSQFNIHKAKHSSPTVDIVFLNLRDTMWRTQIYPPIKGKLPTSRIHFGAAVISNYLFVFGGIEPTSKVYQHVDLQHTQVHSLNLTTMRWDCPVPTNSSDNLIEPLRVADSDVIRARRRIDEEKFRGISMGARNGKTVELAEAESVLKVCEWRRAVLQKESTECIHPPNPRFGCTLTTVNQRLIYCGGWEPEHAVKQGDIMVLNLEQEHEKRRRLDDEFKARLERDRVSQEAQAHLQNVQSVYELRAILFRERESLAREWRDMQKQDVLSALAPLSKPRAVTLVKANQHTMWVSWERVTKNSSHRLIDPDSVTYYLYAQIGFQTLLPNDRVMATHMGAVLGQGGGDKKKHQNMFKFRKPIVKEKHKFFDDTVQRFPGEIIRAWGNGTFDILFDDGRIEKDVSRERIKLAPPLSEEALARLTSPELDASKNTQDRPTTADSRPSTGGSRSNSPSRKTRNKRNQNDPNSLTLAPAVKSRIAKKVRQKQNALVQLNSFRKPILRADEMETASKPNSRQASRAAARAAKAAATAALSSPHRNNSQDNGSFMSGIDDLLFEGPRSSGSQPTSRPTSSKPNSRPTSGLSYTSEKSTTTLNTSPPRGRKGHNNKQNILKPVEPTVKVDALWRLIYAGNDCNYVVTGLVPTEAIENEANLVVPVAFCVQTHGLDSPDYERSQLSERVVFLTSKPALIKSVDTGLVGNVKVKTQKDIEKEEEDFFQPAMSKTRKDIITAVINGQQMVQIERRNNAYFSQGVADDYM